MSASNKTITIRQGCRYAWREWNIFWKLSPKFFYATFASAALTALSPYATVWLSAQLVGELSGGRDPHRLMVWVLWTLGTTAVLTPLEGSGNGRPLAAADPNVYGQTDVPRLRG